MSFISCKPTTEQERNAKAFYEFKQNPKAKRYLNHEICYLNIISYPHRNELFCFYNELCFIIMKIVKFSFY